jgi:TldD protein
MKTLGCALGFLLVLFSVGIIEGGNNRATPSKNGVLLQAMQQELQRSTSELGKLDPAPYYASYSVYDEDLTLVVGSLGSIMNSSHLHHRAGDVSMRVGSADLDNTHAGGRMSGISSEPLPLRDDPDALARVLWQLSYREYRKAAESYLNVKTKNAVRTHEEDTSPDFSVEKSQTHIDYGVPAFHLDQKEWEQRVRRYSGLFRQYPEVYSSLVLVMGETTQLILRLATAAVSSHLVPSYA